MGYGYGGASILTQKRREIYQMFITKLDFSQNVSSDFIESVSEFMVDIVD